MRGGEVLGGYGYSDRAEYESTRGELSPKNDPAGSSTLTTAPH
jgi:hypothetical protein